jgi:signal transduction histidine kinase/CheY-like chemotaxis protein
MPVPSAAPRVSDALAHLRPVVATILVGTVLSAALFFTIRGWERREAQTAVNALAAQRVELLRESLGNSLEALHSLRSFFVAQGTVDRTRFQQFVSGVLSRHPELQAMSWTPRVPAIQRTAFEVAAQSEGFPHFHFTQLDSSGHLVPARATHDAYYPVYFIEPLARNLPAFGYDLNSRIATLTQARDSGTAVSTPPIQLVQEQHEEPGFIVYLPVFGVSPSSTVEERRANNIGFVAAVFRIADLVNPALSNLPGLRVEVDEFTTGSLVSYAVPRHDSEPDSADLIPCTVSLPFAGREWLLTFTPSTSFDAGRRPWQSWTVLVGGLFITGLLAAYFINSLQRGAEVTRAHTALQSEVVERKRAEEAAASANRAKSDFLASLSHEIRTPLNSILGYTQILERDPDFPHRQRDAVGAIANSGRHLLGLLNSILDLSKIEAGRMDVHNDAFDLHALVKGIAEMFKPDCADKHLELRVCFAGENPRPVVGDEGKLRQVLINLLGNAVKFTPRGEVAISVSTPAPDQWRFEVADTGIGLTNAERAELFTPFHQTNAGRRVGGTGLGLAIARRHVELLGGEIEVHSEQGIGTRFIFTLPLPTSVVPVGSSMAAIPRLVPGVAVRALIIDDNRDNRRLLARMLTDFGCRVATAATAATALDIAKSTPEIIFMDMLLAETTGPALLDALHADGLPADVPVIYHTALLLSPAERQTLLAKGASLLVKPFRIEDLCICLMRVPGVRFEALPPDLKPLPLELDRIVLPHELCNRMTVAAELHSTTVLKACLDELRELGGPYVPLADHLRHLLRAYDFTTIARLLGDLRVQPPALVSPASAELV